MPKGVIILILLFALIMTAAYVLYNTLGESLLAQPTTPPTEPSLSDTTTQPSKSPALKAPDFTVYDKEGNPVKLSDFYGKPIVLNFWASWCGPCRSEMPAFEASYQQLGEQIHFLMVNAISNRESLDSAKAFLEDNGYTFPVLFDIDMDAAIAYQLYSIPATYFLDAEGYLVNHSIGMLSQSRLQKNLSLLLSK